VRADVYLPGGDSSFKVGRDTYHHDAAHPSRLVLPERPRS
jgi:hypothetical protein